MNGTGSVGRHVVPLGQARDDHVGHPESWAERLDCSDPAVMASELSQGGSIVLDGAALTDEQVTKLGAVLSHAACPAGIVLSLRRATVPSLAPLLQGAATNLRLAGLDLHGLRVNGLALQASDVKLICRLFGRDNGSGLHSLDLGEQELALHNNPSMRNSLTLLLFAIERANSLRRLCLNDCSLGDAGLTLVQTSLFSNADLFRNPTQLTEIALASNGFTPQSLQAFIFAVGQFLETSEVPLISAVTVYPRNLRVIDLSGNAMTADLDRLFLQMVQRIPTLEVLEPYSSDSAPNPTGAEIARQLDRHCMSARVPRALAMAECLSERNIPRELIYETARLILHPQPPCARRRESS